MNGNQRTIPKVGNAVCKHKTRPGPFREKPPEIPSVEARIADVDAKLVFVGRKTTRMIQSRVNSGFPTALAFHQNAALVNQGGVLVE
jgi:hypothetical protein